MKKINEIINIDLHIHSEHSKYKEEKDYVTESNEDNIDILLEKLNAKKINLFAITDHNRFSFELYKKFKERISENLYKDVLKNLPGIEFDVQLEINKPSCHIICIFDDSDEEKLKNIGNVLGENLLTKSEDYYTREQFEKILKQINLNVLLIAHQHKNLDNLDGGVKSFSNSVSDIYEFIKTGYLNALEYQKPNVQGMIMNCLRKINFNVATIIGSDCHQWRHYPKKDSDTHEKEYITKIKALPTFSGLVFSFTNMENRFNRMENKTGKYIRSVMCNGEEYMFSKGINAIIGDNGAGKSFLLNFLYDQDRLPKHYSKLKEINNISKDVVGIPNIYYIRQNQIIEQVKEGKLFKDKNLYEDIVSVIDFSNKIKTFAEKLIEYIYSNIQIKNKRIEINNCKIEIKNYEERIYVPQAVIDIKMKDDMFYNRFLVLNQIKENLDNEIKDNEIFYSRYKDQINIIEENMVEIVESLQENSNLIKDKNYLINQIISALKTFNQKMDANRTDKEKEILLYRKEKEKFCKLISEYIELISTKPNIPKVPEKMKGFSEKLYEGFRFIKKAKYDDIDIGQLFLEELFKKGTSFEELYNIDEEEHLVNCLSGITKISDIQTWYNKVNTFIEKYSEEENYIEKSSAKNIIGETPGEISAVHYEFVFNDLSRDYDVLLVDQPEDDISNTKIKDELIRYINQIRDYKQVILVTHNPLLVVNLDADNVICLNKSYKGNLMIQNGCLEYENEEYKIIENVANIMDGGKEAIERRFKLYGN